jgi:hypothetical protein
VSSVSLRIGSIATSLWTRLLRSRRIGGCRIVGVGRRIVFVNGTRTSRRLHIPSTGISASMSGSSSVSAMTVILVRRLEVYVVTLYSCSQGLHFVERWQASFYHFLLLFPLCLSLDSIQMQLVFIVVTRL